MEKTMSEDMSKATISTSQKQEFLQDLVAKISELRQSPSDSGPVSSHTSPRASSMPQRKTSQMFAEGEKEEVDAETASSQKVIAASATKASRARKYTPKQEDEPATISGVQAPEIVPQKDSAANRGGPSQLMLGLQTSSGESRISEPRVPSKPRLDRLVIHIGGCLLVPNNLLHSMKIEKHTLPDNVARKSMTRAKIQIGHSPHKSYVYAVFAKGEACAPLCLGCVVLFWLSKKSRTRKHIFQSNIRRWGVSWQSRFSQPGHLHPRPGRNQGQRSGQANRIHDLQCC
jgi:hypothetical protein